MDRPRAMEARLLRCSQEPAEAEEGAVAGGLRREGGQRGSRSTSRPRLSRLLKRGGWVGGLVGVEVGVGLGVGVGVAVGVLWRRMTLGGAARQLMTTRQLWGASGGNAGGSHDREEISIPFFSSTTTDTFFIDSDKCFINPCLTRPSQTAMLVAKNLFCLSASSGGNAGDTLSHSSALARSFTPPYRGTSPIRNTPLLESYSRTRVSWWS